MKQGAISSVAQTLGQGRDQAEIILTPGFTWHTPGQTECQDFASGVKALQTRMQQDRSQDRRRERRALAGPGRGLQRRLYEIEQRTGGDTVAILAARGCG